MAVGEVPGSMYGLLESGWIDGELFDLWFRHLFPSHIPPLRPLLLLLEGYSFYYTPSVISIPTEKEILMFCLPPPSTQLTQPLDKGCFSILKKC